jgi:hypothetical protein
MVPVPVMATAVSAVMGISPLKSPVRPTPSWLMAAYQARTTMAVTATAR